MTAPGPGTAAVPSRGMSRPRRWLAAVTTCALFALGGCVAGEPAPAPSTSVDAVGLRLDRLNRQMAEVAAAQNRASPVLQAVLQAVREIDGFVAGMRSEEHVRETEKTWPRVDAAFLSAEPDGLREPLVEIAVKVDSARSTLSQARRVLEEPWEQRYLDAEDRVLIAVRSYAEATDALVQILQRHWPTYAGLHAASSAYVSANEFYRSSTEAVQAYEVRVTRLIGPWEAAKDEIARFREGQVEAARAVNEAAQEAEAAWDARTSEPVSPGPGAPAPSDAP